MKKAVILLTDADADADADASINEALGRLFNGLAAACDSKRAGEGMKSIFQGNPGPGTGGLNRFRKLEAAGFGRLSF